MSEYALRISAAAEADLEGIASYIALDLQESVIALKQIGRIKDAMMTLGTMPERHGIVSDKYLAAKGIRMLPADNYLVFYMVNKSQAAVNIVRVLYGRREWEALL